MRANPAARPVQRVRARRRAAVLTMHVPTPRRVPAARRALRAHAVLPVARSACCGRCAGCGRGGGWRWRCCGRGGAREEEGGTRGGGGGRHGLWPLRLGACAASHSLRGPVSDGSDMRQPRSFGVASLTCWASGGCAGNEAGPMCRARAHARAEADKSCPSPPRASAAMRMAAGLSVGAAPVGPWCRACRLSLHGAAPHDAAAAPCGCASTPRGGLSPRFHLLNLTD
mgnify:CR=1 FL=1